jgi:hypothetical protein
VTHAADRHGHIFWRGAGVPAIFWRGAGVPAILAGVPAMSTLSGATGKEGGLMVGDRNVGSVEYVDDAWLWETDLDRLVKVGRAAVDDGKEWRYEWDEGEKRGLVCLAARRAVEEVKVSVYGQVTHHYKLFPAIIA